MNSKKEKKSSENPLDLGDMVRFMIWNNPLTFMWNSVVGGGGVVV